MMRPGTAALAMTACSSSANLRFRCDNPINGGLLLTVDVIRATDEQEALRAIRPMKAAFVANYVKRLDGPNVMGNVSKRSMLEGIREDINRFRDENKLERVVMIWEKNPTLGAPIGDRVPAAANTA